MAQFPDLARREADDMAPDNGLITIIAPDGSAFGQSLYGTRTYYEFRPVFPNLTEIESNDLIAFEQANRSLAFDYYYRVRNLQTRVYSCFFLPPGVRIFYRQSVISAQAFFRGYLTQTIP